MKNRRIMNNYFFFSFIFLWENKKKNLQFTMRFNSSPWTIWNTIPIFKLMPRGNNASPNEFRPNQFGPRIRPNMPHWNRSMDSTHIAFGSTSGWATRPASGPHKASRIGLLHNFREKKLELRIFLEHFLPSLIVIRTLC